MSQPQRAKLSSYPERRRMEVGDFVRVPRSSLILFHHGEGSLTEQPGRECGWLTFISEAGGFARFKRSDNIEFEANCDFWLEEHWLDLTPEQEAVWNEYLGQWGLSIDD